MLSFLLNKCKKENKSNSNYIPKDTYVKITDFLKHITNDNFIILCIGTNRTNIIDFLGPFVGSILKEDRNFNIPVYGTMVNPLNGLNLEKRINKIKENHPNSKIIAIDACLSNEHNIGKIIIRRESLRPGTGSGNNLGEVGDISIKGIVGPDNINLLVYNADMNFISSMAYTIAKGIKEAFIYH